MWDELCGTAEVPLPLAAEQAPAPVILSGLLW
jgi:hypothetical protein